jgi:hypothetical protein
MYKEIGYAYPTSDTAKSLNRLDEGCWFVRYLEDENTSPVKLHPEPFETFAAATIFANGIDLPYSKWSIK